MPAEAELAQDEPVAIDRSWPPARLTVVYDEQCELCRRCRRWLATQPTHVELQFLATGDTRAVARYAHLPWYRIELMVITDTGVAWVGPEAFLMCLWATRRYRSMSYRISARAVRPMVEKLFHTVSANRSLVSGMLTPHRCESDACHSQEPTTF